MRRSTLSAALLGLSLVTLAACGTETPQSDSPEVTAADPSAPSDEEIYAERFAAYNAGNLVGLNAYDPLKPVPGTSTFEALPRATETTISTDALSAAEAYAAERNSSALIIVRNGQVELERYFEPNTSDSLLVSRSLAKPLGVIAIGRAIAEGHIDSVDQSAADFITEWKDTPKQDILIRHLLDMRTGLLPQGRAEGPDDVLNRAYLHPRHDEVIINEYPLVGTPGERYDYANANSELVAVIIERATGIKYEDWLAEQVFQPLGARGGDIWMNREGGTAHAGCCILLPADTYLRMALLYLNNGNWQGDQLLPEGFVDMVATATPQNPHAGMGVYVAGPYIERRGAANPDIPFGQTLHSEPYLAEDLFLFDGNGHQVAYIVPSADLVILRTGTRPDEGLDWDNSVLPNTILSGIAFPDGEGPAPQSR